MIDGQTSELKLLPWTWEMVAECCANILDSRCSSFWPGLRQRCDLDFGSCMRHTFVGSVIIMWSYNQNIMRLAYPCTKPIVTTWLTDFWSKLWQNWYWYICASASNSVFWWLRTRKAQTSQRIRAVWSAPLLVAYCKVSYLDVLQAKIYFSSKSL